MPLAGVTGLIAVFSQQLRERDLAGTKVGLLVSRKVTVDPIAVGRPASQNRRAGW